jgi:E3 ubiquitin-protein ligase RNF14
MESPHGEDDDLSPSPEAVRMLRQMALREGEEPDLPDEQLRSNDQLQQDEVLPAESTLRPILHYR